MPTRPWPAPIQLLRAKDIVIEEYRIKKDLPLGQPVR